MRPISSNASCHASAETGPGNGHVQSVWPHSTQENRHHKGKRRRTKGLLMASALSTSSSSSSCHFTPTLHRPPVFTDYALCKISATRAALPAST